MTLTSVDGVEAGHWTHPSGTTGTTVVLFPDGARGGLCLPGHASASRELAVLDPLHLAGVVHGFCLTGGSAFGLAAVDGVVAALEARGVGFDAGVARVPIVPAAALFDLAVAQARPDAAAGALAARAASRGPLASGRVGAGAGATVAKVTGSPRPGGFGQHGEPCGPWQVAVGVAVNAFGTVRDADTAAWVTGPPAPGARLPGQGLPGEGLPGDWRGNTTLAVIVTDAPLDRAQCTVVARMASAGLARALWPAFAPFDGDTVFVGATGVGPAPDAAAVCALGDGAARCLARAIVAAVSRGRARDPEGAAGGPSAARTERDGATPQGPAGRQAGAPVNLPAHPG